MTAVQDKDLARLRAMLDARAEVLRAEVGAIDAEKADFPRAVPMSQVDDAADRGEERTREAMRHAEQERDIEELRAIAAAIARMADGSYGVCVDCGVDIPLARLVAQPTASRCVPCQQRFETSHRAVPRVTLPPEVD